MSLRQAPIQALLFIVKVTPEGCSTDQLCTCTDHPDSADHSPPIVVLWVILCRWHVGLAVPNVFALVRPARWPAETDRVVCQRPQSGEHTVK